MLFQSFSNQRSLSLPCLSAFPSLLLFYFIFFTKAACYFQHRQQFIFPGELTVKVSCCIVVLPSFHSPKIPRSSLCPLHVVAVTVGVAVSFTECQQWDCMITLNGFLTPSAGGSGKLHDQSFSVCGGLWGFPKERKKKGKKERKERKKKGGGGQEG